MSAADTVLLVVLAVLLTLGLCVQFLLRRRQSAAADEALVAPQPVRACAPAPVDAPRGAHLAGQRICVAFHGWLADCHEGPEVWASFDQLVREALGAHLGASRVRCYRVQAGSQTLQAIHQTGRPPVPAGPPLRETLLGHVATTGREYVGDDPAHGPLLDELAARAAERWSWIWPVRQPWPKRPALAEARLRGPARRAAKDGPQAFSAAETIGLIAVGPLNDPGTLTPELRQTIGPLLSLCWQHVASLQRLRWVQRTDQASGVLTRGDFFAVADAALRDSYSANEPVVVGVLALEGLRRLDDTRCWGERDALIERLGQHIARRMRSDDVVGRFADDRFAILLRRLDTGLGRLIGEKLLETSAAVLAARTLQLRMGLAGSGLAQPTLAALLGSAFDAVERARKGDIRLELGDCEWGMTQPAPQVQELSSGGPALPSPIPNPQPAPEAL